jgi:rhodanese-related sulfurtransferase
LLIPNQKLGQLPHAALRSPPSLCWLALCPRRKNFKEEESYEEVFAALVKQGVQFIKPGEATRRRGAVLLDVRLADAATKLRIPQAVSAPLYRLIQGFSPFAVIRRAAFTFFAIPGTERNPEWLDQVSAATKNNKGAEIIVVCERGGSLTNKPGMSMGFQSRSLKAVYLLRQAGFRNVKVLDGGMYGWGQADLPLVTDE